MGLQAGKDVQGAFSVVSQAGLLIHTCSLHHSFYLPWV